MSGKIKVGIRAARLDDIEAMQSVERLAGRRFAGIGMDSVADHPPPPAAILADYVQGGRAWIVLVGGQPVGYAIADVVDGSGHLEQVSVDPGHGRQGLGRMLIQAVVDWATARGLGALTLLTFRDVPWNGPYYAALGFRPLAEAELTPGLMTLRVHETALGLDWNARLAMRLDLPTTLIGASGRPARSSDAG